MAINLNLYSNGNGTSKAIAVDFSSDFLASSSLGVSNETRFFMKFTTAATDEDGGRYGSKIVESLSDLVLNGEKQRIVNTADAYTDIKSMVIDYVYDYIHGHTAGQNGATIAEKKPIKFN